jgi:large conductance mechanosensitive channel
MLKEFRDFAMRGNLVDLAVGLILGTAFGTIVNSLVNDIIMPPIGLAIGGIDFSKLAIVLQPATIGPDGAEIPAVAIHYGKFMNAVFAFLVVSWVMFLLIKAMNRMKAQEAAAPPPPPTASESLLAEIRDLLKK